MRSLKAIFVILFLTLTAGIYIPNLSGNLYPWVNITFTFGIILIILLRFLDDNTEKSNILYILPIAVISIVFRLRIFLYPASLIGGDPDAYAIQMAQVIKSGDISSITFGFYSQAPFHFLEGIMASLITGLSAPMANLVFPILCGAVIPLLAASFAHRLRPGTPKTTVLAAGGTSILGYTVEYSYLPIAQTTGVLFLGLTIFSLLVYSSKGDCRWLALALLTMVGSLYTHKLSAIAITLSVTGAISLGLLHPQTRRSSAIQRLGGGVIGLFGVLTVLQLLYVTGFATTILFRLAVPETSTVTTAPTPTSAFDPYSFGKRLFRLSYVLMLAVLAGLVWFFSLWRTLRTDTNYQLVLFLGFVAPLAGLVVLLYPSGVHPARTILYSETLLFVLLAVGLYWPIVENTNSSRRISRLGTIGIVLLLVTTAGVSPIIGPDWGSSYRTYLNTEEVEAKEWGYTYVPEQIATDQYYAGEIPPSLIPDIGASGNIEPSKFKYLSRIYIDNNLLPEKPSVMAHRSCIDIIRSSAGPMRPTYNAEWVLSGGFNRFYDSGCVSYYSSY